jgi:hypothetical protein
MIDIVAFWDAREIRKAEARFSIMFFLVLSSIKLTTCTYML